MTRWLSRYAIVAALVLECVILAVATDSFFTSANLSNVLRQNAFTAILAAGMTIIILPPASTSRSAQSSRSRG
jgi:ribose transport system permease protein